MMRAFESICVGPEFSVGLLNLVLAAILASGSGLAAALLCRRCAAPVRHGVLLCALGATLLSPALVWSSSRMAVGRIVVTAPESETENPVALESSSEAASRELPEHASSHVPPPPSPEVEAKDEAEAPGGPIARAPVSSMPENSAKVDHDETSPPLAAALTIAWWSLAATLGAVLWATGSLLGFARLVRGRVVLTRFRRTLKPLDDGRVEGLVRQAAQDVGLRRAPPTFVSPATETPLTLGLLRPALVLPEGMERQAADAALRAVLLHESAHLVRGDHWIGAAQRLAVVLYWWNPMLRRIGEDLSQVREEICDNHVLRVQGDGRPLAELLVDLAARACATAPVPSSLGVLPERRSGFRARVVRLLSKETDTMTRMSFRTIAVVAASTLLLAGLLATAAVRAEPGDSSTEGPVPSPRADEHAEPGDVAADVRPDDGEETPAPAPGPYPGATLRLEHDRDEYFVGEPIEIRYVLKNEGTEVFPVEFGGDYRGTGRADRFKITAIGPDGKKAPDAIDHVMDFGGLMQIGQKLEPGQERVEKLQLMKYRRLETPDKYRIRVTHDLGWDAKKHRPPVAETTITLKLPNEEEAWALIAKSPDLSLLRHPVYLPMLLKQLNNGRNESIAAIASIRTPESTRGLIDRIDRCTRNLDFDNALAAYGGLGDRLPNPRFYQDDNAWHQVDRERVAAVWRPEFAKTLRFLAERLARDDRKNRGLGVISFIYECVGQAEDMPMLILGYTKAIQATETLPFETHQYFRPRGASYGYRFSTRRLLDRGAEPPTDPKTTGEAAVYLIAMQEREDFRPADWPEQVVRWLGHETPYMREFVLDHMPSPPPEEALKMLPELMADDYVDLQIAASHAAKRNPREAFREPLRNILRTETEQYLLNAATGAGPANGVATDEIMEIWLDRLDAGDLGPQAVVRLLLSVLDDNKARTPRTIDAAAVAATRERWGRFIEEHREDLRKGRRFKLGDPEITPDLFPTGFQFYKDGKPWPPER